jgi:DNA-binding beta-propeller fold protein YncE
VDPAGSHLYLAAQGSNAVGAYTIGSTGTLTAVVGQPFATGGTQYFGDAIVMNASGTMLYVQDQSNLFAYAVSAATGALTLVQTISVAGVGGLALDPNGAYLYAAESAPGILATYNIASSNGLLTLAKTYATGQGYTITISPTGQFAYSYENPNLVAYGVDNGTFSRIGVVPGVFALRLAVDPSGSFLYAPQACSQNCPGGTYNVINEFAIGNNGSLTSVAGSPVSSGTAPYSIAFTTQ